MSNEGIARSERLGAAGKRWRRNNRRRFNRLLARLLGTPEVRRAPLAPGIRRVLVVRLNKRLGNILFLTPMLRSLAATLPEARIDVLIQSPAQAKLLQSLPGIGRVWIQENRVLPMLRTLRELRAQSYDLAIDPTDNSASNRIGLALIRARQRMGFAHSDQWLPLTHAAGRSKSRHQALQAVELLSDSISGLAPTTFDTLAVFPDAADQAAADEHWRAALGDRARGAPVIGFFSRATGPKALSRDWWLSWILAVRRALPHAVLLEILPCANAEPVSPEVAHVAIEPLTELAALMARLDQFIAADSGPMHLAAASATPVIGLFRATRPSDYAPLGQDCETIEGDRLTPNQVAARVAARITRRARLSPGISGSR